MRELERARGSKRVVTELFIQLVYRLTDKQTLLVPKVAITTENCIFYELMTLS